MYEKEHDYGNVWAQKELAAKMKRESAAPFAITRGVAPITSNSTEVTYLNPVDKMVANGAKQFVSYEDVIAKLLGGS